MADTTALARGGMTREERKVILASSLGTVFEWYDFYLYGSLAAIIGAQFFSMYPEATRNVFALLAFAAGFLVRPFGALLFGHLGDIAGRKTTFLLTILIMGASTFLVALLPGSESIGILAPALLILLRMLQGLALGGEYGGAATYVAEHAPADRRGFYTSFIQITATGGLLLSLVVIMGVRAWMGEPAFLAWGWRIPFAFSIVLLFISVWIRLQLAESPAWQRIRDEGGRSKAPLREAFGTWRYGKMAMLALLGLTAGQAVVWYTGQFYALFFMGTVLKVDTFTANALMAWALLLGCPFFVFFGWLSDKIGRKPVILGGCLLAGISYLGIFPLLSVAVNPSLANAQATVQTVVRADPATCSFQFNPTGTVTFTTPCDVASAALARASVAYSREDGAPGSPATVTMGTVTLDASAPDFRAQLAQAIAARYPAVSNDGILRMQHAFDLLHRNTIGALFLLWCLVLMVTMVYGPIAAALVELFPTRIRYTAMSLPYHIGNGWFGGLLPATVFAMSAQTGDPYFGLWYPVVIALGTAVIGLCFIPETKGKDIFADDRRAT
jgi:hypothetical protein